MSEIREGWVSLVNSPKFHYVRDGRSLCKRWGYLGSTFDADDERLGEKPQRGDCVGCWRARKQELAVRAARPVSTKDGQPNGVRDD